MSTNLIEEVKKLVQEHKDKGNYNEFYKKECSALFEQIKVLIPDKVKEYASYGKNEAVVYEFKLKENVKIGECFVKDLLTKGNVIDQLQKHMDTAHADGTESAFYVYFNHVGPYQNDRGEGKFGVLINWDKDSWVTLKERQNNRKTYSQTDETQRTQFNGRGNRGGFGRGRSGRGGFGRGGFGRGSNTEQRVLDQNGDIGHVQELLIDEDTWTIRYFIVNTGNWWVGHQVLIAAEWITDINWIENKVYVDLTRELVQQAPLFDPLVPVNREQELGIHLHYNRKGYWEA